MKVKLGLNSLDFDALANLAESVQSGMVANATVFDHPNPSMTELATLVTTLREKISERVAADEAAAQVLQELYAAAAALRVALSAAASYVDSKAQGDPTIIAKANMGVRAQRASAGPMPKLQGLKLSASDYPGAVDWMCSPVPNVKAYLLYVCTTDPSVEANWHYANTAVKSSGTLTGLAAGKVWLRVVAKGSDENPGPPSDAALEMVR